ncbi:hypothetical protein MSIBF_A680004 [groundwater metagenome]|uniref:Uncharacterized protein n=1 Tax=groundwater metagenome TaxID=717931 RepID=A0A098EEG7_9ZZZZ
MAVEKNQESMEKEIKDMDFKEIGNLINNKLITKENNSAVKKRIKEIYIKNKENHKNTSVVLDLLHKLYPLQLEIIAQERFDNSPLVKCMPIKSKSKNFYFLC